MTVAVNSVDDVSWSGFMDSIVARFGDLYDGWGGVALAFTAVSRLVMLPFYSYTNTAYLALMACLAGT